MKSFDLVRIMLIKLPNPGLDPLYFDLVATGLSDHDCCSLLVQPREIQGYNTAWISSKQLGSVGS